VNYSGSDVGLRGGQFTLTQTGNTATFTLDQCQWVDDLPVSGTVNWYTLTPGPAVAKLTFNTPAGAGSLTISWYDMQPQAQAAIQGTIGGRTIVASTPAP
ncbi:MAG: hypothetical protein WAU58_20180, partial [Terriglobales bacterium]